MPRPGLPPTPASSTDLSAKESSKYAIEHAFTLGPPAIQSAESSASSNVSVKSDSSYAPASPASSRKRPRPTYEQGIQHEPISADYSLPPPPTRSRRIIQMKPDTTVKTKQPVAEKTEKKKPVYNRPSSAATAAGKKTARKTAHSIIERRRRSKMNEEFDTLKGMIPACNGQQMHKLAILQAGIDYMRYLEQCVNELQDANRGNQPPPSIPQSQAPTPRQQSVEFSDSGDDEDVMDEDNHTGVEAYSNATKTDSHNSNSQSQGYTSSIASPAILPCPSQTYHRYSVSNQSSTAPSPAFGPRTDSWSSIDRPRMAYNLSTNTSPAILPQLAQDAEEASAALLMLNHDRRHSRSERTSALSVMDLLSH
ncbi:MAG: hypothetical protein GOMPHAMPRED_000491 [Gomphillus americanus]|uniref:BHLH domain-containing protein n=1 Tax=Gomphillus americanus TaxID=1940652 RepID=A0A8H3EDK0_9LECA|nr:MAG: hypothetical protein GOMPHAMPRED_000491 [Gomphillus americanus]